jgi:hypothetical protein
MAPKAGRIQQRTRVAEFDIEGDDWRIEFRPFSSDMLREATQGDEAEQFDGICKLLGQTVVAWNLEGDDGKPMVIAPDMTDGAGNLVVSEGMAWLRSVGLDYVKLIFDGIVEVLQVPKPSASASSGSFSRAA